jgi:hypothetical protein
MYEDLMSGDTATYHIGSTDVKGFFGQFAEKQRIDSLTQQVASGAITQAEANRQYWQNESDARLSREQHAASGGLSGFVNNTLDVAKTVGKVGLGVALAPFAFVGPMNSFSLGGQQGMQGPLPQQNTQSPQGSSQSSDMGYQQNIEGLLAMQPQVSQVSQSGNSIGGGGFI